MHRFKLYQVDAFADKLFSGNPAAVCILDKMLNDDLMQSIGNENNLAETAFILTAGKDFEIRWFTPTVEVDLCGHATLASAFVLFNILGYSDSVINFHSPRSGSLTVEKKEDLLFLDFPADGRLESIIGEQINSVENCIGVRPLELFKGKTDYMAVVDSETSLQNLQPDFKEIFRLNARGLIVTAKGDSADFVSRFFAPQSGVNEDQVTGSAHTTLIPFWSNRLGKEKLYAKQLSKRGGQLLCELKNDRCIIGGTARLYLTGEINLD
jgi:PhzF family phenazine biosynthesis protein